MVLTGLGGVDALGVGCWLGTSSIFNASTVEVTSSVFTGRTFDVDSALLAGEAFLGRIFWPALDSLCLGGEWS
eukprot:1159127-Pyramimonas_sp.AAC.3